MQWDGCGELEGGSRKRPLEIMVENSEYEVHVMRLRTVNQMVTCESAG